jgi:hypothetical protein
MKKIALFFVILSSLNINAQKSKREEGIVFGVKGGMNFSNFVGTVEDQGIRSSIHLGLLAEIMLSDNFSIQPELLYSKQGATYTGQIPGFKRTKLDYILLPLEAKFKLIDKLSLEVGPQLGILMSSRLKTNTSNDKIDGLKSIDFGINAGLQYHINNAAFVQGRYFLGLSDTRLSDNSNNRISNSVIQLSIGYLF